VATRAVALIVLPILSGADLSKKSVTYMLAFCPRTNGRKSGVSEGQNVSAELLRRRKSPAEAPPGQSPKGC
jgi:hypothetical protein